MKKTELIPLTILHATEDETIKGRTRMQKLSFMVQQEADYPKKYIFKPYDYGPFCSEAYSDLDDLEERGLVKEETEYIEGKAHYFYSITEDGKHWLYELENKYQFTDKDVVKDIVSKWENKNLSKLLSHVYSEWPRYASESVI